MRTVSFVARASGSGKTTLIEKVVAVLKKRGFRVAVVKHASKGFDLDRPGKDSWRFRRAGADAVVLAGPTEMALVKSVGREPDLGECAALAGDVDVLIVEGFKSTAPNRIEVFRRSVSGVEPLCRSDRTFLALASDARIDAGIPWLPLDDAEAVADLILGLADQHS